MDDVDYLALAHQAVEYVEERVGRPAAWLCAIVMIIVPPALICVVIASLLATTG